MPGDTSGSATCDGLRATGPHRSSMSESAGWPTFRVLGEEWAIRECFNVGNPTKHFSSHPVSDSQHRFRSRPGEDVHWFTDLVESRTVPTSGDGQRIRLEPPPVPRNQAL